MGKKIFISYKFSDSNVSALEGINNTTARDYVNVLQDKLEESPHIFKAEEDDNDLSKFKDDTIASKLRDKIFDSTVTVVLISPNMKDSYTAESDQWIPWEISYSLKEYKRNNRKSPTNGMLAVVLPDKNGSYYYFFHEDSCPNCHCMTLMTNSLFTILRKNMFNIKNEYENRIDCSNHSADSRPYSGNPSYIPAIKWSNFIQNMNTYIDLSVDLNDNISNYTIYKEIS